MISSKNNQESENQGKDALNDTTTNQTSEKKFKDEEESNNPKDKAAKKYYQMIKLLTIVIKQPIKYSKLKMIQTTIQKIMLPVTSNSKKDID